MGLYIYRYLMIFFLCYILMKPTSVVSKNDITFPLYYMADLKNNFDITAPNDTFYKNLSDSVLFNKSNGLVVALQKVEFIKRVSKKKIDEIFESGNKKLLKGIFVGNEGDIYDIKEDILNGEMGQIKIAVQEKVDGINDKRIKIIDDLMGKLNTIVTEFMTTTSSYVTKQVDFEFKSYLDKIISMKESGKGERITIDKTKILEIIDNNFNLLPGKIEIEVQNISTQFLTTSKEKCQEEDVKTENIVEKGTQKLEEDINEAIIDVKIVGNYTVLCNEVKAEMKGKVKNLINFIKVESVEITDAIKYYFNSITDIINTEYSLQLQKIPSCIKGHIDEVVENLLN